jgi:hypothetical protein
LLSGGCDADDRCGEGLSAEASDEREVGEVECAAVGGDEPVAVAGACTPRDVIESATYARQSTGVSDRGYAIVG